MRTCDGELSGVFLYSDVAAAGGTQLSEITTAFSVSERANLERDIHRIDVEFARADSAYADASPPNVVRLEFSSGCVKEFRISRPTEEMQTDGRLLASLRAEAIRYDLNTRAGLVARTVGDGSVEYHIENYALQPSAHLDFILATPTVPGFFSAGTVESTARVDMVYDMDTPGSALRNLAEKAGLELEVVRNGVSSYDVNLVSQVGSGGDRPTIDFGRNQRSLVHERETEKQATRAYPFGRGPEDTIATMGRNRWLLSSVSGSDVVFANSPIGEDDQLNGFFVRKPDGTFAEITNSDAGTQTATLADASGLSAGDYVRIVEDGAGKELTFLESPSAKATHGLVTKALERRDVPDVVNLVPNPFFRNWSGGLPVSWETRNDPLLVERETASQFRRFGPSSAHVSAGAPGAGIQTIAGEVPVFPTNERPFLSLQIAVWVVSGQVEITLVDLTNGEAWPPPRSDKRAVTSKTGTWVKKLGVAPGENFFDRGTEDVQIRVFAAEAQTEFYIDAAMVTPTAGGASTFWEGSSANDLWREARDYLFDFADPKDRFETELVDLEKLGLSTDEAIELGATADVVNAQLGIDADVRFKQIERNHRRPGDVRVQLGTVERTASERFSRPNRPVEERISEPEETMRPGRVTGFDGTWAENFQLTWDRVERAARYEVRLVGRHPEEASSWEKGAKIAVSDDTGEVVKEGKLPDGADRVALMIKAISPTGLYSRVASLAGFRRQAGGDCTNLGGEDTKAERCSSSTASEEIIFEYADIDMADTPLDQGDSVGVGWEGKANPA